MATLDIPLKNLSSFIRAVAERNGVEFIESKWDAMARIVTRLAGDDVKPDDVEGLLLRLNRKGCIAGSEMLLLHFRYLDEIKAIDTAR